ncbi:JAB domain-containing protein [Flavivirga jejuensis]|uniref:JAB domain-containing protein n=1 Tax=Flavivirga jejuensis TaxID=870487 RepID=A0ABT8WVP1_9FLAO|nr:JAB domain-containing protein [Flavivirga jejuensis]MDO5977241.1 JAB domain-containing protein [Flavivirga jejuensis]
MSDKVNEIKISYIGNVKFSMWEKVRNSKDSADLLFENWDKDTIGVYESFKILLLNNSNKVKGIYQVSQGGITGTLVDLRILFAVILKSLSVGIVLCHNHPSGKLIPSESDIRLTKKIKNAADLFDVNVLDHLIITPNGDYYSFADNSII